MEFFFFQYVHRAQTLTRWPVFLTFNCLLYTPFRTIDFDVFEQERLSLFVFHNGVTPVLQSISRWHSSLHLSNLDFVKYGATRATVTQFEWKIMNPPPRNLNGKEFRNDDGNAKARNQWFHSLNEEKYSCCTSGTLFGTIIDIVWQMTTWNFHFWGSDHNASPREKTLWAGMEVPLQIPILF